MNDRRIKPYSAPPFALATGEGDPLVVTLPVPGYRQARNYCCGFAATLMVLRYFGRPLCGEPLFRALGTAQDGTGQASIVRVLKSEGLRANLRYDMTFNSLARTTAVGKDLIGYLLDEEHWVVLYGFGRGPERIFVADPEPGKPCVYSWAEYGERLGGYALVCSMARPTAAVPAREQLALDFGGAE